MKRKGNLFERLTGDENLNLAIDEVNQTHRWHPHHKPNKVVAWVDGTKAERVKELREIILQGFDPSPSTPKPVSYTHLHNGPPGGDCRGSDHHPALPVHGGYYGGDRRDAHSRHPRKPGVHL